MSLNLIVNGIARELPERPGETLLDALRDGLGLTGTKFGCGEGACGACTVLVGRRAVTACQVPAAAAAGQRVTTVEGLAEDGLLHPVQQAWLEEGALQCGYCTPGWLTATAALLDRAPHPDDARIAAELAGNVCRCCTYPRIRRAVRRAADLLERPEELEPVPALAATSPAGATSAARQPPWDLSDKLPGSFAAEMPDGLLAVVADEPAGAAPAAGTPAAPARPGWGGAGSAPADDAWVHVAPDGAVTAYSGKVEAGQGTRTALALLVAEELAVASGAVRVLLGDTDRSPFDLGTFGSRAMPYAAPPLRAAAAGARRLLTEAAAARFGLTASQLTAAGGVIAGPDGAPSIGYGELVTGWRRAERVPADEPVTPAAAWRTAGHRARALGSADAVTGRKVFPGDLRLDGMLHGCVLRPPSARAELRAADTSAAARMDGVTVVRDGAFVGVAAPGRAAARQALAAIRADWVEPPQPSTADLESYLREHPLDGEGWGGPFQHEEGDPDAAQAAAATWLTAHYTAAYIAHVPLEPRAALADWRGDQLTVWTATSTPFRARRELAAELGIPEPDVHVIVPDYGGGFGGKHGSVVALEAARLARGAGRPVRVQWTREEEFRGGYLRPAALIDAAAGTDATGQVTCWSFTNINSGAAGILTPYRIPSQRVRYQPAAAPLPQGSYRALAATANNFARESLMDELAAAGAADPVEFRLRQLDDGRLAAVLEAAADGIGWGTAVPDGEALGIALGREKGGRVATAARVRVGADGALTVLRLVTAVDCGAVVHPDGLANQAEGAVMMGLGGALFEAIEFADGQITNASLGSYQVPRLADLPEVRTIILDQPDQPSAGGGETPIIAVAPAIGNAVFRACGLRLRAMPLAPDGHVRRG
jgi:isoquinoline 1-oxidoreductase